MTRAYCAIIATPARLVFWGTWEKNGGKSMWFLLWQWWCSYGSMSLPAVPSRMPKLRTFSAATNRVGFDLGPKHIPTCHRCWYWFVFFSYPLMKSVFFSFHHQCIYSSVLFYLEWNIEWKASWEKRVCKSWVVTILCNFLLKMRIESK